MARPFTPILERMLPKIDFDGPCWLWKGSLTHSGYGQVGRGGKRGGNVYTHRAMWECLVGPIPPGMQVDHLCKQPACCNPDHLEPVTPKENTRRSAAGHITGARNRAKTHCPAGHAYDALNTRFTANGRACRTCDRERYWKKKEAAA